MMLGLIEDDGYTEDGYIAEVPRLHPALRFRFRPMLSTERAQAMRDMGKAINSPNAKQSEIISAKLMAERILEWDLKDGSGNIVPVTADMILRVKPQLSNRLYAIVVLGTAPSDEDPESEKEPTSQEEQETGDLKN
jgi:hypothetical protein